MPIPEQGRVRVPGPIGLLPGGTSGRLPGPLAPWFPVTERMLRLLGRVMKMTTMPPPSITSRTLEARKVAWSLYSGEPDTTQVRQGELATCPIAAILAAFAHTSWGRERIQKLLGEHHSPGGVKTTLTDAAMTRFKREDPDDRPQSKEVISDRYFTVKIKDPPIEVSDVFYVEYTDRTFLDPIYMQHRPMKSPEKAPEVLWPAVVEKAYAAMIGDYEKLDDYGPKGTKVDVYWTVLAGSKPEIIGITAKTSLAEIRQAAESASNSPTIGASKEKTAKVLNEHGFAILGMQGGRIDLYDPHGNSVKLTLEEFRADFKLILRRG